MCRRTNSPKRSSNALPASSANVRSPTVRAWYFSENAYPYLPDPATYDSIRVNLPSRYYDPEVGAALYDRYIEEWQCADDLGLNVMINEHHQTATNLNPSAAVVAATLGRLTKKARILILG